MSKLLDYDGLSYYHGKVQGEISQLQHKVSDISTGKYYGYYATAADLPEDVTVDGFAYVGSGPTYTIYNCVSGVWTSSDVTVNQSPIGNDEDIDQNEDGKLQFAKRIYNAQQPNGMGYKILRTDASFASQVTDTNTIYEIRYPFTLSADFTMPTFCTLKFCGGKLGGNVTLTGDGTTIEADNVQIFDGGISFSGPWYVAEAPVEWYGAKTGVLDTADTDVAVCINKLFGLTKTVKLGTGVYYSSFGQTINLSGTLRGERRGRGERGTMLRFRNVQANGVCIMAGVEDGGVADRVDRVELADIVVNVDASSPAITGHIALHIGSVNSMDIRNVLIYQFNKRSSEYSSAQYEDPVSYSNIGIKLSGTSQFIRIYDTTVQADICLYAKESGSYDFTSISQCCFVCEAYGFASLYGQALTYNGFISNCSFNQGIFGIKWAGNATSDVGIVKISGCRIEQLRGFTYSNNLVTAAIDYTTGAYGYDKRNPTILLDSVFFATYTGVRISGEQELYLSMVGCSGTNLSGTRPAIDIYNAPYTWVKCVNCYVGYLVVFKINEETHQVRGVRVRNQQNASYVSSLSNALFIPITDVATIRAKVAVRYESSANRVFSIPFEQNLATGSKSPFFDRLKLWDNDNKCIGYSIKIKVFGPGVYGEATYLVKYAVSNDAIDATNGTISIIETKGDDIFSTNGPGNYEAGKMSIYISTNPGSNVQLAEYNNIGKAVHIVGEIEAYLTAALLNS